MKKSRDFNAMGLGWQLNTETHRVSLLLTVYLCGVVWVPPT